MIALRTILALLIILLISCNNYRKKSNELYLKAKQDFNHRDFENALDEVDNAIKIDSLNYELYILKSKIKNETSFNEEAIRILKSVLKLNKNYKPDTINFLIGYNFNQAGDYFTYQYQDSAKRQIAYKNALIHFDSAIKINSQYINAYYHKQLVLINLGRSDEAIITLNNAIRFSPGEMSLIYARGNAKYNLGDFVGGIIDLNTAILSNQLDSLELAIAYRYRGNLYSDMDSIDNALQDFTKAISYNPDDYFTFAARGELYRKNGDKEEACADFRKAGDLGLVIIYKTIREYCSEEKKLRK